MATEENKQFIRSLIDHWRPILFLDQYTVHSKFESTDHPDGFTAVVRCDLAEEYHTFTITYYPQFFTTCSQEEQEDMVVHELAHVLTDVLTELPTRMMNGKMVSREELRKQGERVTDWMKNSIFMAIERGRMVKEQEQEKVQEEGSNATESTQQPAK